MLRCPVVQVFRAQGAVDLCRASWSDLDYALGEMQGIRLQRTTTLVEGADRCDFRLIPASQVTKAVKGDGSGNERQDQEVERFRTGGVFSAEKHEQIIGTEDSVVDL